MTCSLLWEAPGSKSSDVSPQPVVTTKTRKVERDHGQDRGVGVTERGTTGYRDLVREMRRGGAPWGRREANTEEGAKRVKGNGRIQPI